MNKVILVGFMGENPVNSTTKTGKSMTKFKLSVKKEGRLREGEAKNYYFPCVAFDHTADYLYKYANHGSKVAVEGSIDNYSYMVDGAKRYGTQIMVKSAEIVSSTVNAGDFQQPQDDGLAQYQEQPAGTFTEVEDAELPFL